MTTSRQKLLSRFEFNIGNMAPNSFKMININVISLIEGTLELQQMVRYQIKNNQSSISKEVIEKSEVQDKSSTLKSMPPNVTLDYIEDVIVKTKKDTISIVCVSEFVFRGQFFTLNKEPLRRAVKHEEFLFQVKII